MRISLQSFQLNKSETMPERCEDAFAILKDDSEMRIAVSDGASESYKSRLWSRALVETYVIKPLAQQIQFPGIFDSQPLNEEEANVSIAGDDTENPYSATSLLRNWLEEPITAYSSSIDWGNLPWNQERAAQRGAAATLLGLTLQTDEPVWNTLGIGDTNLFLLREGKLQLAFPILSASEFDSTPQLLSTITDFNNELDLRMYRGEYQSGDIFVLATDALAWWILDQIDVEADPWSAILYMEQERFEDFVHDLRSTNSIRDDDITLVIAEIQL